MLFGIDMDDRARALLRDDPLSAVRRPRARTHAARQFRLPTMLGGGTIAAGAPLADHPTPRPPPLPRAQTSSPGFRERTLTWFREGDELDREAADLPARPPAPRRRLAVLAAGLAALVAVVLVALV